MTPALFAGPHGFRVEAEDGAVSEARRKIIALVRAWDVPLPQDTFGDLELLSSEVITNAVRYTRAPCAVVVFGAKPTHDLLPTSPSAASSQLISADTK